MAARCAAAVNELPPRPPSPRTLVLGLGNPCLGDDAVGLHVVAELRSRLRDRPGVEVSEDYCGGLRLMERLIGFERAIVVDACCTGAPAGTVRVLVNGALPTRHGGSSHDVDLNTALAVGRCAGAALPPEGNVWVVAVEATEVEQFRAQCTPPVAAAIPAAARAVEALLTEWG